MLSPGVTSSFIPHYSSFIIHHSAFIIRAYQLPFSQSLGVIRDHAISLFHAARDHDLPFAQAVIPSVSEGSGRVGGVLPHPPAQAPRSRSA
jgi:hypothetical protein